MLYSLSEERQLASSTTTDETYHWFIVVDYRTTLTAKIMHIKFMQHNKG